MGTRRSRAVTSGSAPTSTSRSPPLRAPRCRRWATTCGSARRTSTRRWRTTSASRSPTGRRQTRRSSTPGRSTCAAGSQGTVRDMAAADDRPVDDRHVDDLAFLDATAQAALVRSGELAPIELVDAAINRTEKLNPELNAVIHPLFEKARATAAKRFAKDAPFRGVPMVLKDLDGPSAGDPFHLGNKLLKEVGYVADHDSFLIARLRAAGFVAIGKSNCPEFGLLPTTEPEAYGPTRNPWNTAHSPGGSSGGSGAAVASGMVPVGHAGDGGGSIRIPASACGLFGLKPTRGRVSLGPAEAEAWAGLVMRHVVTRTVRDSAAVLDVLQGYMTGDWYTAPPPARAYAQEVGAAPAKLRIGVRTTAPLGLATVDPECIAAVDDTARVLES